MYSVKNSSKEVGSPIQKSAGHRFLAPHRSLSQPDTSFIASYRLGIHQMLLLFLNTYILRENVVYRIKPVLTSINILCYDILYYFTLCLYVFTTISKELLYDINSYNIQLTLNNLPLRGVELYCKDNPASTIILDFLK